MISLGTLAQNVLKGTLETLAQNVLKGTLGILAQKALKEILETLAQNVLNETLAQNVLKETLAQNVLKETLAQNVLRGQKAIALGHQSANRKRPNPQKTNPAPDNRVTRAKKLQMVVSLAPILPIELSEQKPWKLSAITLIPNWMRGI